MLYPTSRSHNVHRSYPTRNRFWTPSSYLAQRLYSTSPGGPAPSATRPVTLRSRPFLLISAFLVLHQTVATTSLLPTYYLFKFTDSATSLLAGPYAAFILRQSAPWPLAPRGSDQKMEDVVENMVRGSVTRGWGLWTLWRERKTKAASDAERAAVAEDVVHGLEGNKSSWKDSIIGGIQAASIGRKDHRTADIALPQAEDNAISDTRRSWRAKAAESASDIKLKDAMNMAAAYLVVKALFPVRLGASFYFAPKLARIIARRWA